MELPPPRNPSTSSAPPPESTGGAGRQREGAGGPVLAELAADRARLAPRSNYELFNCNNFNIRYWSWNYRGCWHQTCPPIATR